MGLHWSELRNELRDLWECFLGLIYPRLCLACEEPLVRGEDMICIGCWIDLPYTDYHLMLPNESPLARRFWGKIRLQYALSYLVFVRHGRVQHLMHQLKYRGIGGVGTMLGVLYGRELKEAGFAEVFDLIVPVPLHPQKMAKRGFNQAALFAEGLSQGLGVEWSEEAIVRGFATDTQTKKNRLERWRNVESVFVVGKAGSFVGKKIVVVDDVLTTGATLEACCAVLLENGAAEVSIATIACA